MNDAVVGELAMEAGAELREAERRLFAAHGVAPRERWLQLERPSMRMRVLELGEGAPTLHVHGGGGWGSLHVPLAAELPGRRHILIDRPGFGLSERIDVGVGPAFRARAVEMLASALDAPEVRSADVVGNSSGAGMSLWLALERPDRVRSLALVGGAAMVGSEPAPWALRLLSAIASPLQRLDPPSEKQVRALWKRFGHDAATLHPTLLDPTLAAERVPAYARAWTEILRATLSLSGTRPGLELSDDELRRIAVPVAFAWGARDPMVDLSVGRRVAAIVRNARFQVTGIGHLPWLDDAAAVARAIEPVLA